MTCAIETLIDEFAEIKKVAGEIVANYFGVSVSICQGKITFRTSWDNKEGIARMCQAKQDLAVYLLDNCTNRKWNHVRFGKKLVGYTYADNSSLRTGVTCAIKAKLTDEEHNAILRGVRF